LIAFAGRGPWRHNRNSVDGDPFRHFAAVNCRSAKGLFDHLVGAGEDRRGDADDANVLDRDGTYRDRLFGRAKLDISLAESQFCLFLGSAGFANLSFFVSNLSPWRAARDVNPPAR